MTTKVSSGRSEHGLSTISGVGVALDGSMIARGTIGHPPDKRGIFPSPDAAELRISRVGGMRVVRCRSTRDISGFLRTEEFGGEVSIPSPLADILERAFRLGLNNPVQAQLNYQIGALADSTSTIKHLAQPLSNWTLHADEQAGSIVVSLTATLRGNHFETWQESSRNFWGDHSDAQLQVSFEITPQTRLACFDTYVPALEQGQAQLALIPTIAGREHLDIRDAPVGTFAQFAIDDDRWIHFYESEETRSISFTEHDPPARTELGFLLDNRRYRWPRVTIRGVDMKSIAQALESTPSMRLSLRDGHFGHLTYGGSGGHWHDLYNVNLAAEVTDAGLVIRYDVVSGMGTTSGGGCLLWELLLLRYPQFAKYRLDSDHAGR